MSDKAATRCLLRSGKLGNLTAMKHTSRQLLTSLLLLALGSTAVQAQTPPLRLEPRTNSYDLVLGSMSSTGVVFLYQAPDLQALADAPSLMLQTNTPLASELRLPVQPASGHSNSAFFAAGYWPGRSVDEFGDPTYAPDPVPPDMILLTSGAPDPLVAQQAFTVDFYITDTAGELLNLSAPAAVLVLRESDGLRHPDAVVTPPGGTMTNGHLRLTLTIQATTPLDSYTLGLALTLSSSPGGHAKDMTTKELKQMITLNNIQCQNGQTPRQCLDAWHQANTDAGPSWSYPLAGSGHAVAGTFGEWRGKNNNDVHRGIDLAAVAASTVRAARGGVVSCRGTLAGMGDYLVVDHGGGWYSRYLHLNASSISVRLGQAVARGDTLATGLFARTPQQVALYGRWGAHLHFEIRYGADQAQWGSGSPGSAQDPLQTWSFAVAAGVAPPKLEEFGLTRKHPGQTAFVKGPPTADANGPVYVFAKLLDVEAGQRLGLRAMSFQPEGASVPVEIRPQTDAAITPLLPPGTGTKGFAGYSGTHAANPDRLNYYRYWWQWDTSGYANNRSGPRTLLLTGEDHNPTTADFRFLFGPQIKDGRITPLGANQYQFTSVANLGATALENPELFVQPDQYKLEILKADGQPLPGVTWTPPLLAGDYTRVFTVHLDEVVYTVTLPGGTTPDGLKLRVSSRLAPDLAHEVALPSCSGGLPVGVTPVPNMIRIPCGTFTMGSPASEPARFGDEVQHRVTLSQGFWMGKYEVTQGEYSAVMGSNPSYFQGGNLPVETVSWNDAVAYCAALTARERSAGRLPAGYVYRLPTEAEWEYACRADTTTPFHYGNALRSGMANFDGRYEYPPCGGSTYYCYNPGGTYLARTTSVGSYAPNAWGLYDLHGNVWEWCQDWYGTYPSGSVSDPQGAPTGSRRVIRGGDWDNYAIICRSAQRYYYNPTYRYYYFGFRVVLAPGQ